MQVMLEMLQIPLLLQWKGQRRLEEELHHVEITSSRHVDIEMIKLGLQLQAGQGRVRIGQFLGYFVAGSAGALLRGERAEAKFRSATRQTVLDAQTLPRADPHDRRFIDAELCHGIRRICPCLAPGGAGIQL